jgi:hypothetical protein
MAFWRTPKHNKKCDPYLEVAKELNEIDPPDFYIKGTTISRGMGSGKWMILDHGYVSYMNNEDMNLNQKEFISENYEEIIEKAKKAAKVEEEENAFKREKEKNITNELRKKVCK